MNESNPNRKLPSSIETRKEQMLVDLQGELASFHRRRNQKRMIAKAVAVGFAVLLAGFALLDFGNEENPIRQNHIAKQPNRKEQPAAVPEPSYTFIKMVGNNPDVSSKYTVGNSPTVLALELVDDEELLSMMAANGHPSFLGKINGELRLIPSSRPAAN